WVRAQAPDQFRDELAGRDELAQYSAAQIVEIEKTGTCRRERRRCTVSTNVSLSAIAPPPAVEAPVRLETAFRRPVHPDHILDSRRRARGPRADRAAGAIIERYSSTASPLMPCLFSRSRKCLRSICAVCAAFDRLPAPFINRSRNARSNASTT